MLGGGRTGYPSRVPREGCSVEGPRRRLIRPGSPTPGVSLKPAFFAGSIREECGLGGDGEADPSDELLMGGHDVHGPGTGRVSPQICLP